MVLHVKNFRMSGSYYFALVGGGDRPLLELEFNHKKEKDQRMVLQVNPHASPEDIKLPITPTSRSFLVNSKLAIIYLFETRGTLCDLKIFKKGIYVSLSLTHHLIWSRPVRDPPATVF